jgi:hypothetical protein
MNPPEDTVLWRLAAVETLAQTIDKEKADTKDVNKLSDEVAALRRSLIVFSLSMVGSGGAFLIGVLALLQHG